MKKVAVTSAKMAKVPMPKIVVTKKAPKITDTLNTDALDKPHLVPGKPHNFRYK